jgi:hypothetical protein
MLGSGTHGLQSRTRSPPTRRLNSTKPVSLATGLEGYPRRCAAACGVPGGCTTYWKGIRMRCGLHDPQTTRPHFLQWCFRTQMLNCVWQIGQSVTSASGCHLGSMISDGSLAGRISGLVILAGSGAAGLGASAPRRSPSCAARNPWNGAVRGLDDAGLVVVVVAAAAAAAAVAVVAIGPGLGAASAGRSESLPCSPTPVRVSMGAGGVNRSLSCCPAPRPFSSLSSWPSALSCCPAIPPVSSSSSSSAPCSASSTSGKTRSAECDGQSRYREHSWCQCRDVLWGHVFVVGLAANGSAADAPPELLVSPLPKVGARSRGVAVLSLPPSGPSMVAHASYGGWSRAFRSGWRGPPGTLTGPPAVRDTSRCRCSQRVCAALVAFENRWIPIWLSSAQRKLFCAFRTLGNPRW